MPNLTPCSPISPVMAAQITRIQTALACIAIEQRILGEIAQLSTGLLRVHAGLTSKEPT